MIAELKEGRFVPLKGPADRVAPDKMNFRRDIQFRRSPVIVLVLQSGALLGQALCVLHRSHMESDPMEGMAAHAPSSTAGHTQPTVTYVSSSMAVHVTSQHEHTTPYGETHSGACAVVACGSAVTVTPDHRLQLMGRLSKRLGQ